MMKHIMFYGVVPWAKCYSEDTECLTADGWKPIKDVRIGEPVLALDPKTMEMRWERVVRRYEYNYSGPMFRIKSQFIDLLVTPNHMMFVAKRNKRGKWVWRLEPAVNVFGKRMVKYAVTGRWKGARVERARIGNREVKVEDFLRFLGFYLAEGWYVDYVHKRAVRYRTKNGVKEKVYELRDYTVGIRNFNHLNEIAEALRKVTPNRVYVDKERGTVLVRDKELWSYVRQFGRAHEKFVPKFVKELPPELLRIFIEAFEKGDGSQRGARTGKKRNLYTSSPRLRDDLQEIAIKAGYGSSYSARPGGRVSEIGGRKIVSEHGHYTVSLRVVKGRFPVDKKADHEVVRYNGKIYCLEVPSHVFLVRRNGKAVFCGNSAYGKNCWNICSRLKKYFRISIMSFLHDFAPIEYKGLTVYPRLNQNDTWGIAGLRYWWRKLKPDILLQHFDHWVLGGALHKLGIKYILYSPLDQEPIPEPFYPDILYAEAIFAMSRWAEELLRKSGFTNVYYVPHGVDLKIYRRLPEEERKKCRKYFGLPEDAFIWLFIGSNLGRRKNIPNLLRAFKYFVDQTGLKPKDTVLVLHTYPHRDQYNQFAYELPFFWKQLGIAEYIKHPPEDEYWLGFSEEEMNMLYNAADCYVTMSMGEGYGLPLIESAAVGLPAIAVDYTSSRELVEGRGELVRVAEWLALELTSGWQAMGDTYEFAEKMVKLYNSPSLCERYSKNAIELAKKYDWDLVIEKYFIPALNKILEKG